MHGGVFEEITGRLVATMSCSVRVWWKLILKVTILE